jgi:hypothetical protein
LENPAGEKLVAWGDDAQHAITNLLTIAEAEGRTREYVGESDQEPSDDWYEGQDGDHESALASAGFGTDEDYGGCGDDDGFCCGEEW